MARHSRVFFSGQFQPAVSGQAVATRDLANLLESRGVVLRRHVTSGAALTRLWRYLSGTVLILFGPERIVYLSVNMRRGLPFNILMAAAARLAGKALRAHHHNYGTIARFHPLMAAFVRVAGKDCVHFSNCVPMGREMEERYRAIGRVMSLSNIGSVDDRLHPVCRPDRPVTIGHMSSLMEEKGIDTVIDAVIAMRAGGVPARLVLAGPDLEPYARGQIRRTQSAVKDDFRVVGPVHGEEKQAFFDSIDIFAFATRYAEETQGIVNLEAMACGKPVVAFAQCCIASDIGEQGGVAVSPGSDFSAALTGYAEHFLGDPATASREARARFETLREAYRSEVERVVETFVL